MFLYWKEHERLGTLKNENYTTPKLVSGLRTMSGCTYTTGTARFIVSNRGKRIRPTPEGRKHIERLETYFGWDEIVSLSGNGIILKPGQTKLEFDEEEYRLVEKDDLGLPYDHNFNNVGLIKAIFERETTHGIN